jgi:hypothetical protein
MLAPHLPASLMPAALAAAATITDPAERAQAVGALGQVPAVDPALLHRHVHQAMRAAAAHGESNIDHAIATLAPAIERISHTRQAAITSTPHD